MVIRDFKLFSKHIKEIYQSVRDEDDNGQLVKNLVHEFREGKGNNDGNEFGVALCTIDGQEIAEGDAFGHTTYGNCKATVVCFGHGR